MRYTFRKSIIKGLHVLTTNRSFAEKFRTSPEETVGQLVYRLGNGQWDIPRLRELLEEILPRDTVLTDYEVEHEFPSIGRRRMLLNARRVDGGMIRPEMILLSIEDATAGT